MSFSYSSLSSAPAAQTPVGSGQVLQGCANFNLDRNRNMPDHGLRHKASRQQEPRLPSQALTQGCISLLPYQLNNVKLHYLVVRNEALHSREGVPGADCTAATLVHTSHKLDVKLFWFLPLLVWDLTFNTQQQLFCDNLPPAALSVCRD